MLRLRRGKSKNKMREREAWEEISKAKSFYDGKLRMVANLWGEGRVMR